MLTDRFPRVLPFAVLLGWCAGLIAVRAVHAGRLSFGFLVWNLGLAAVPLLASVALGWAAATAALMLSAFGVYLGRFLRWNSWDALLHPWAVATEIARMLANLDQHPRLVAVTLVYGSGLLLGYVALRGRARGQLVSADARDASAR